MDSNDKDRMGETKKELMLMLEEEELNEVPVMIFANKQDLLDAMSDKEITESMSLHEIKTR